MDSMLGKIKDIVESKYPALYNHIHKHVVKSWDNINVPLHALVYVLTPNSTLHLGWPNLHLGVGLRENPIQILSYKMGI